MEWRNILASGGVALASSVITAVLALRFDARREMARRRSDLSDRLLDALSAVNRLAETTAGLYGAVADPKYAADNTARRSKAGAALNDAWYATRHLDVLLPSVEPLSDELRNFLRRYADEADRQANAGEFDRRGLDELGDVRQHLDRLRAAVRAAAGFDELIR